MSVKELEKRIATLPPGQFLKLADWFDGYRASLDLIPAREDEDELSPKMRRELERRLRLANEHPERLEPWEGTVARVRARLHELRRQKAARS